MLAVKTTDGNIAPIARQMLRNIFKKSLKTWAF
jgi:hypothetical protein